MVKSGIMDSLKQEKTLAIRSHIIRSLPEIVGQARELESSLVKFENMSTRMAQMVGALTAGAGFLSGDMTPIFTNREIRRVNPADVREETVDLLQELLGQMVMSGEKSHHVTLAECLQKEYKTTASRYGFKLNRGDDDQRELWCAFEPSPHVGASDENQVRIHRLELLFMRVAGCGQVQDLIGCAQTHIFLWSATVGRGLAAACSGCPGDR